MQRRSPYQQRIDRDMEITLLRLAAHMPDLLDELRDAPENHRRAITRRWIKNCPGYAEMIVEGLAMFVAELQDLARAAIPKNRLAGLT